MTKCRSERARGGQCCRGACLGRVGIEVGWQRQTRVPSPHSVFLLTLDAMEGESRCRNVGAMGKKQDMHNA